MGRNEAGESDESEISLYRDMDIGAEGEGPMAGPYNFALGVRTDAPPLDIEVCDGYVRPAPAGLRGRGMCVAPGGPRNLNQRHRPPSLAVLGLTPYGVSHQLISAHASAIGRPARHMALSNRHIG